jgi:hypothetical protein
MFKPGVMVHINNPSNQEDETEGSPARPCLKEKKKKVQKSFANCHSESLIVLRQGHIV